MFGSPSRTNFELLVVLQKKPEPIVGIEKGHILLDMALKVWLPSETFGKIFSATISFSL
jgi:hypothetical protein